MRMRHVLFLLAAALLALPAAAAPAAYPAKPLKVIVPFFRQRHERGGSRARQCSANTGHPSRRQPPGPRVPCVAAAAAAAPMVDVLLTTNTNARRNPAMFKSCPTTREGLRVSMSQSRFAAALAAASPHQDFGRFRAGRAGGKRYFAPATPRPIAGELLRPPQDPISCVPKDRHSPDRRWVCRSTSVCYARRCRGDDVKCARWHSRRLASCVSAAPLRPPLEGFA